MLNFVDPQQLAAKLVRTKRAEAADFAVRNINLHRAGDDQPIELYWQDVLSRINEMQSHAVS